MVGSVLYGICCQQGVSGSAVCGAKTAALYCQQADEMYIKMSWILLILSVPIVGIPCYFLFRKTGAYVEDIQKRMARIGGKHMRRFGA